MILERVTPESVGIHSEGILKFIDLAESRGLYFSRTINNAFLN